MSPLPANFSGLPGEELHKYFRNLCITLKKTVKETQDIDRLQEEMEHFFHTGKKMDWMSKPSPIYKKGLEEKVMGRVWSEFKRYVFDLQTGDPSPQDLIDAISEVEQLVASYKVL